MNSKEWCISEFAACASLDTRLIPDLHDGGKGGLKQVEYPVAVSAGDLDALAKRFSCDKDTLIETAFGLAVSVWNADTKAFFPTAGGTRPVLVEWTPDQPLAGLLARQQERKEGVAEHSDYTYEDCVRDLEPGFSASFDGPDDPEAEVGEDALAFRLSSGTDGQFLLRCQYRSDQYSAGIFKQFADSYSACLQSMGEAETVGDLAFATEEQVAETESFNPNPSPATRT